MKIKFIVNEDNSGKRLDVFCAENVKDINRSIVQKLINETKITTNSQAQKAGYRLKVGDHVVIDVNSLKMTSIPKINLPIIYQDKDVIVINKPPGILTHSKGVFNPESTVASFISDKINFAEKGNRDGIVHRLDRATSGVMVCARNVEACRWLKKQFSNRRVKKIYIAIVDSIPKEQKAIIDMPIERNPKSPQKFRVGVNGRSAVTAYEVLSANNDKYLIKLSPTTGRTHQLRVHLKSIGCSILGDELYGGNKADRLYLHAKELELTLPSGERKVFISGLPEEFDRIMSQ